MPPKKKKQPDVILPDFKKGHLEAGDNYSFAVAQHQLDHVFVKMHEEIRLRQTLRKLPEYNVEYHVMLAYNVNMMVLKSHDEKKDDKWIMKACPDDGNLEDGPEEPVAAEPDRFFNDRISRTTYKKAVPDVDINYILST